jgi:hypothetical protein
LQWIKINQTYNFCSLTFRNLNAGIELSSKYYAIITYTIGNHSIKDVYVLQSTNSTNPKDIKITYFTLTYGVIAYELFTGEVFELEEKHFK